ncbi:hypothetical protein COR50_11385 [Chitinophaga caeni]|uniref:Secretin/TonB short N-terminal domain-containing protein n=1 Tax=Chitinophaga caeni TaxID=2029983 RepID=A0A291QUU3_9BACT|nr:SusC/RagA family TonB-linked outer membrane protein [Chitinophaga caeni]ATL47720.1 hypothetical protein COR50_11385 [Chitinophaga caeni]
MTNYLHARYPDWITYGRSYAYFQNIPKSVKKIAVLLFILINFSSFGSSIANAQQINLELKNTKLTQAFASIREQTGYLFSYKNDEVDKYNVTLSIKNASIEQAMDACLQGLSLSYDIKGNLVIVFSKSKENLNINLQQEKAVSGTIIDENGDPIIGANIWAEEINKGTITDNNGNFTLVIGNKNSLKIRIRFIGFIEQTITVNNSKTEKIILKRSNEQLKGVTISTGYQEVSPERFVGSAVTVDSSILSRNNSVDIISRIDGTINGVLFNKVGGIPRIQLRGINSIKGASDITGSPTQNPLIIVDDFPYNGDIHNLNPNDVESISVLKDAAATSIWGTRAANGVIVIKTKKGLYNKRMAVSFNSNFSVKEKPDLSYFPRMTSSEFIDVETYLFNQGFYDIYIQYPFATPLSPVVELLNQERNGTVTQEDAQSKIEILRHHDINKDYEKFVLRNGFNAQNFLNINGGGSEIAYNISFGSDNGKTSIKGPGSANRYTISSSIQLAPINKLKISASIDYTSNQNRSDGPGYRISPGGGKSEIYPYASLIDENGLPASTPRDYAPSYVDTVGGGNLLDWKYYPLIENESANVILNDQFTRIKFELAGKLFPGLTTALKYQYSIQNSEGKNFNSIDSYYARNEINKFTEKGTYKNNLPIGGIIDRTNSKIQSQNIRGQLNYKNSFGRHEINALVAGEISSAKNQNDGSRIYGYDEENLTYSQYLDFQKFYPIFYGGSLRIPNPISVTNRIDKFVSFLANLSYSYNEKYSFYLSGRKDGANILGIKSNNKWKPLWSVGARWNISNEAFFDISTIERLVLRSSYGYAGNVNNTISSLATITYSPNKNFLGQPYSTIGGPPNPDLKWEEVGTFNIGLDFGILRDRISGSIDWYTKKSNDLISYVKVDRTLGFSSIVKNSANTKGNGFELLLNTKNLTRGIKWNTSLNFSYAKTVVTNYFDNSIQTPTNPTIRQGDLYDALYAYIWKGLDPATGDPQGYLNGKVSKDYNKIFQDTANHQKYIGSSFPLLFGNILNNLSFKAFNLSFNIVYRGKYYFRKPSIRYDYLYNRWIGHSDFRNRWQKPGDEKNTNVPSMPYPVNESREIFYQNSEVNIEKGDNARLQDIRLSYSWINRKSKPNPFKSVELYFYANNLNIFLFKHTKSGYDPDYPAETIPPLRNFSFGIKANL